MTTMISKATEANRARCYNCPDRHERYCSIDAAPATWHAAAGNCPKGRYATSPSAPKVATPEPPKLERTTPEPPKPATPVIHRRVKIDVPTATGGNCSLLPLPEHGGEFLMLWRPDFTQVHACRLDFGYRVIPGTHVDLDMVQKEDPRVIRRGSEIIATMSFHGLPATLPRMELWSITSTSPIVAAPVYCLDDPGIPSYRPRCEKNWMPWVHGGNLYFTYSIQPHRILRAEFRNGGRVEVAYATDWQAPHWRREWGQEFRGSTPPVQLPDGTWLSTFHTVTRDGYRHAFFRYSGEPPFKVFAVSRRHVLSPADATGRNWRQRNDPRRRCIFLMSMQIEGDLVRLAGGDNDCASVVLEMSLCQILEDMVNV